MWLGVARYSWVGEKARDMGVLVRAERFEAGREAQERFAEGYLGVDLKVDIKREKMEVFFEMLNKEEMGCIVI